MVVPVAVGLSACGKDKGALENQAYADMKTEYASSGYAVEDVQSGVLTSLGQAIGTALNRTTAITKGFIATQNEKKIVVLFFEQDMSFAATMQNGVTAMFDAINTQFSINSGGANGKYLYMSATDQDAAAIFYKHFEKVYKTTK